MNITRRHVLKGFGAALALPFMESLARPFELKMAEAASAASDLRLLFVFVPNGMHMPAWTPLKEGSDYVMPQTLAVLKDHRQDFSVLSGLDLDAARAHGDGPGDHARASAAFLTGMHPRKTGGAKIKAGISVDQVAAKLVASSTQLPSLELGLERSRMSGSCDSGYSCAYSSNISWRSSSSANAKEISPRRVFNRLFSNPEQRLSPKQRARRSRTRSSILDAVKEDARSLSKKLGRSDKQKMEEYLDSVRELEKRIQKSRLKPEKRPELKTPRNIPKDMGQHIDLMYDLVRLAFQTKVTRVATFMAGNAGSNRSYRFLGVREGHHRLSHHGGDSKKQEKIARINRFHVERFGRFLKTMKDTKIGDKSLLDKTLIVFGSGIGDGNRHNHTKLPILLAGHGAGLKSGHHLRYKKGSSVCQLYVTLLRHLGWRGQRFGDASRGLKLV